MQTLMSSKCAVLSAKKRGRRQQVLQGSSGAQKYCKAQSCSMNLEPLNPLAGVNPHAQADT